MEELDQDVDRVEGTDSEDDDMGPNTQKLVEKIDEGLKLIKNDDEYVVKNKGMGRECTSAGRNRLPRTKRRRGLAWRKDYEEEGGDSSKK